MRILVSGGTKTMRRVYPQWPEMLGHLTSPATNSKVETMLSTGLPIAADNGAFSSFDAVAFRRMVVKLAGCERLLWVACPDVVGDAVGTLAMFDRWEPELRSVVPVAFVLQDGQEQLPVPWERMDAAFIGGSTRWKLSQHAADLGAEAKDRGLWLHMGRVNSLKRMRTALEFGCDSIDGGQFSRFGDVKLERGLEWLRAEMDRQKQPNLWKE
jgi:hypothetical protein